MKRILLQSNTFIRTCKKLLRKKPAQSVAIFETLKLLEKNAFHSSLRTHKLSGNLLGSWACSAGYDLRIIFSFVEHDGKESILLETVGTHEEVY